MMSGSIFNKRTGVYISGIWVMCMLFFRTGNCLNETAVKPVIRKIKSDSFTVKLDLSPQILFLDVPQDRESGDMPGKQKVKEATLYPDLKSVPDYYKEFVSASLVAQKVKNFDDGLMASVELLVQKGNSRLPGKEGMLKDLLKVMNELPVKKEDAAAKAKCQAFIYAALALNGVSMDLDAKIKKIAQDSMSVFLKNERLSKPVGIYTWNDTLQRIFQQDRFLQKSIPDANVRRVLGAALAKDNALLSAYGLLLAFYEQMNNPFPPEYCDFRSTDQAQAMKCAAFCLVPPSMAQETELIKRLYGNKPVPEKFSLADALIKEIAGGAVSLKPTERSGWYDYKVYALEPFLLPEKMIEAQKLRYGSEYKNELIRLFKGILALTRETHIKNLEVALAGAAAPEPVIDIYPGLSVEPAASYYLRLGAAYSFIRDVLSTYFSDTALSHTSRLLPGGKSVSGSNLLAELNAMESLAYGMFLISAAEIGLQVQPDVLNRSADQMKKDKETAGKWIKSIKEDADLNADIRMMVPVFYDVQRRLTKVWAVLGYTVKPLNINFESNPSYKVFGAKGKEVKKGVEFKNETKHIIYPVTAEVYTRKIYNREEFRALCDSLKSNSEILRALKSAE